MYTLHDLRKLLVQYPYHHRSPGFTPKQAQSPARPGIPARLATAGWRSEPSNATILSHLQRHAKAI